MPTRRGDVVAVAISGDYGKPRPAVIVQTDVIPDDHPSVVVCQMTSELFEVSRFRITIEPTAENGLRTRSQVMADKPTTVRRDRIGQSIGRLGRAEMAQLDLALVIVMGLAD
jgi:mRNA interferase MazF